jgi:hypothetical protein
LTHGIVDTSGTARALFASRKGTGANEFVTVMGQIEIGLFNLLELVILELFFLPETLGFLKSTLNEHE